MGTTQNCTFSPGRAARVVLMGWWLWQKDGDLGPPPLLHRVQLLPALAGFNFTALGCRELIPNCCRARSLSAIKCVPSKREIELELFFLGAAQQAWQPPPALLTVCGQAHPQHSDFQMGLEWGNGSVKR